MGKNMVALVSFFRTHNNERATLSTIQSKTGVKRNALRQIIYKSNAADFERESHRGGGQESKFWLKEHMLT